MTHRTDAADLLRRRPTRRLALLGLAAGLLAPGCLGPGFLVPPNPGPVPFPTDPADPPPDKPAPPEPAAKPVVVPTALTVPAPSGELPATPPTNAGDLRRLQREAASAYAGVDSYIARLKRREVVRGSAKAEEVIEFKFRQEPTSIHLKWIGPHGKGREVLHVAGQHDNKMHVRMARGDFPLMPAGTRMALDPDSPMVRNASRHCIDEAGVGSNIAIFSKLLADIDAGKLPKDAARYLGPTKREEFPQPLDMVEIRVPAGREESLPEGGTRLVGFDTKSHFPVLIITHDAKGKEVEYYCFDRFLVGLHLDDKDFDPDALWGAK